MDVSLPQLATCGEKSLGAPRVTRTNDNDFAASSDPKSLLILGGTGKLARLMRATKQQDNSLLPDWLPIWAGRKADDGVDFTFTETTTEFPRADAVLALWGIIPGGGDLSQNARLATRAVDVAISCGADKVIHCSSSAVYGPGQMLSETSSLLPLNAYGEAKVAMEEVALQSLGANETSPRSFILRLSNVVGADSLFGSIERGGQLTLDRFADGESPKRSYATPRIVWAAVEAVLSGQTLPDVLNVAASAPVAMHSLLEAANHPFEWKAAPESAIAEVSLDVSELQRLTPTDLRVTAPQMIEEWRAVRKALA